MKDRIFARACALFTGSLLLLFSAAVVTPNTARAQQPQTALTLRAGSPGIGGDVAVGLTSHWNVRAGVSYFGSSHLTNKTVEDVDLGIDVNTTLFSISAIADYFPWKKSGFHLSAGALYNGNGAEASIVANGPYTVGSRTFTAEEIGGLDGEVSFNALAPYVGLGFGNVTALGSRLGVVVDLGAAYHQSPNISMSGTGMLSPTAEQAPQLEENLSSFKFFPVLSLGLSYRMTGR